MIEKPTFPVDTDDDELEQYGVWVKAGPDDVEDDSFEESINLEDLPDDTGSESALLTEEEEELLSDLESGETVEEDFEDFTFEDARDFGRTPDFEIEDDESVTGELESATAAHPIETEDETVDIDVSVDDLSGEEFSLDDLDSFADIPAFDEEVALEVPSNIVEESIEDSAVEPFFDLDDAIETLDQPLEQSTTELDLNDLPDIDEETLPPLDDEDFEGLDIAASTLPSADDELGELRLDELGQEEEDLDELTLEETAFDASEEPTIVEGSETWTDDLSEDSIVLSDLEDSGGGDFEDESEAIDIEHLEGISLAEPESEEDVEEPSRYTGGALILQKIESELAAIKSELSTLKNELSSLRMRPSAGPSVVEAGDETAGFFEEVEDETIALTGDELDNILNTADITEASGETTVAPEEEPAAVPAFGFPENALSENLGFIETDMTELPDLSDMDTERLIDKADIIPLDEIIPAEQEESEADLFLGETEILEFGDEEHGVLEDLDTGEEDIIGELGVGDTELEELGEFESFEDVVIEDVSEDSELESIEEFVEEELAEEMLDEPEGTLEELTDELEELSVEEDEIFEPFEDMSAETENLPEIEVLDSETDFGYEDVGELEDIEGILPDTGVRVAAGAVDKDLKDEIKSVLSYMDELLDSLPEEKIKEFARSDHFEVYKKLLNELGLK